MSWCRSGECAEYKVWVIAKMMKGVVTGREKRRKRLKKINKGMNGALNEWASEGVVNELNIKFEYEPRGWREGRKWPKGMKKIGKGMYSALNEWKSVGWRMCWVQEGEGGGRRQIKNKAASELRDWINEWIEFWMSECRNAECGEYNVWVRGKKVKGVVARRE